MDLVAYLSSEGLLHDNTEQDLSNPIYIDVLYNATQVESESYMDVNNNYYSIISYSRERHSIVR